MAATNDTARLASSAALLSTELLAPPKIPYSQKTVTEILTVADELARLATTLWQLDDAINADPSQYTKAFIEDIGEITTELALVLEDISECCGSLRSPDSTTSVVAWLFRKGRVSRSLQHLEALEGTLLVMRTVLWHGKEYGTHRSDRVAESDPHTMREDRIILASILAQNRDAILDLHALVNTLSDSPAEPKRPERLSTAGDYQRQLSEETGVDMEPFPDVLPPPIESKTDQTEVSALASPSETARRTFSKRGVRLGVHMSILDLSAHEAPDMLKKKWIQQANVRRNSMRRNSRSGSDRSCGLTALPELSLITEVDTRTSSMNELPDPSPTSKTNLVQGTTPEVSSTDLRTPVRELSVPPNTPADRVESTRKHGDDFGSRLKRIVSKLSLTNLRTPSKARE